MAIPNLGGSVNITTKTAEPFASAGMSGGTQGTVRGLGTYSTTQGTWLPYIALEGYRTNGYRDNSFIDRYNSFNKRDHNALRRGDGLVSRASLWNDLRGARDTLTATRLRVG